MRAPGIAGLEGEDLSFKAPSVAAATVEVSMDISFLQGDASSISRDPYRSFS